VKSRIALAFGQRKYPQRSWRLRLSYIGALLLFVSFAVILSSCTNPFFQPVKSGASQTPVPDPFITPTSVVSPTPTPVPPTITLQVVGCPSTLSLNWDSLVGTKAHVNKVQKVMCGGLLGNGTLEALVNVRYYSSDAKLDSYVYGNLSGTPTRLFALQGLLDGDAQISLAGTLITGEIGPSDALKSVPDVFKEYQWNGSTFGQILFPGLYPDMTHYQAEQDQAVISAQAMQGITTWKTSASAVVGNMALRVFHWNPQSISLKTITYSASRGIYIIAVNNLGTGGGGFTANLFRLDNVATNIFEVSQVSSIDGSTLLSSPVSGVQISSPVSANGSALVNSTTLGHVAIYDDTYTTVGDSGTIHSPTSTGSASFATSISYHLNAHGLMEGAVIFFSTSQSNAALSNQAVMIKVFLSA
jgi:hypothetical protein